jgi:hypothetical protein
MSQYLYLSFSPEALIFSMLPPAEFGRYLAIGDDQTTRAQGMFVEIDPEVQAAGLSLEEGKKRCVPHEDGSPRKSVYVGIYRVLEQLPPDCFRQLHLVTQDGIVLSLDPTDPPSPSGQSRHLYQEICPVTARVATLLSPADFSAYVTDPANPLYLPRVFFSDLKLGNLAENPEDPEATNLPYDGLPHLRKVLGEIRPGGSKRTKIERRMTRPELFYYLVDSGFYLGDATALRFYPMPTEEQLIGEYRRWWNSANRAERY